MYSVHPARRGAPILAVIMTIALAISMLFLGGNPTASADDGEFRALVFSKTAGFRHGSIPVGIAAIQQLGVDNGFAVDVTEDATQFTEENLAQYDVVIWLSTSGDVLDSTQQAAFEGYIQAGGGYVGVHSASDTEYDWPWYEGLVGAYFSSHPPGTPSAHVLVEDATHPSTAHLPTTWTWTDELYGFQTNPRQNVRVLLTLDETSYSPGGSAMDGDHPIAWCQDYDGGRSWYTGLGHTNDSFSNSHFMNHLLGGIRTAAGVEDADCTPVYEVTVSVTVTPSAPDGAGGWYTGPVNVSATAETTGAATTQIEISDDGSVFEVLPGGEHTITAQGSSTVWLRATDGVRTSEPEQRTVQIDGVPPTVEPLVDGRTVTLSGSDATSGLERIQYRLTADGAWETYTDALEISGLDAASVWFRGVDNAGNVSDVETAAVAPIPTVSVGADSVAQGGEIAVSGRGLPESAEVELWLHSDPVRVATVTTDATGAFSQTVTVPGDTTPEVHQIAVRQGDVELARSDGFTVTPAQTTPTPPPGDGSLPATGQDANPWAALLGLFLLLGGGVGLAAARRTRRAVS